MTKASEPASGPAGFSNKQIKEYLELVDRLGIEEFEVETEGFRLRIVGRRAPATVVAAPAPAVAVGAPAALAAAPALSSAPAAFAPAAPATPAAPPPVDDTAHYTKITAPMIGTFYISPAPSAPPFVSNGDQVDENSVLCIIEAMKLMNEIKAEMRGTVKRILVENGQPVEYGQPLFLIEPR